MHGILVFAFVLRGALPACGPEAGGSLKIDLDFAHGAGNAVDRIPIESTAIDAVGGCSLRAVERDAHVMQFERGRHSCTAPPWRRAGCISCGRLVTPSK